MRTCEEIQTYIQKRYNDDGTEAQTRIQDLINTKYQWLRAEIGWNFDLESKTLTSVAAQQGYLLPIGYRRIYSVKVTVGGVEYYPLPVPSKDSWDALNAGAATVSKSDIPLYYWVGKGTVTGDYLYLYPTPSSDGNDIDVEYYARGRDLITTDFTDYDTATVSINNGSTTVTGVATVFAETMVGRYIRFDPDGFWYKINSFTGVTEIDIERDFEGLNQANVTYKIGTVFNVPAEGVPIIAYATLEELWEDREDMTPTGGKANYYKNKKKEALKELQKQIRNYYDSPSVNILPDNRLPLNPNNYPENLS